MPELSIITVNYNGEKYYPQYFSALKDQTYQDFELIIVDNGSTDSSLNIITHEFPFAKIIKNKENLGYTKAVNQGIRISEGNFILTLNFDITLSPDYLSEVVKSMKSDPKIGAVTGKLDKIINGKRTEKIDTTGHEIERSQIVKNRLKDLNKSGYVFGVSGAAALYSKEMLNDIKWRKEFLDEDLFGGLDDVDIDFRMQKKGWHAFYNPKAMGYHDRGGAFSKVNRKWEFLNYRNRYLVLIKNLSFSSFIINFPFILVTEIGLILSMAINLYLFSVMVDVLRLLPRFLKKRAFVQSNR